MIALIDCNNFFVSCELTVRPELRGRAVVVGGRGENGGCVVAMSNEAKKLGIPRGIPVFRLRDLVKGGKVTVLPADHHLYSRISRDVMATVNSFGLEAEIYSVDEAFLHVPFPGEEATEFCRYVRSTILERTGIPAGIGISTTKTLAKIAATFAKRHKGYEGVCLMDTPEKIKRGLELTPAGEVWGIGRKVKERLDRVNITTAAQFADMPADAVSRMFNHSVTSTWRELNGEYILDESTHRRRYLSCTCSRTFEHDIYSRSEIMRLTACYAASVARSLRRHRRIATEIEVMLSTNPFRTDRPQRRATAKVRLMEPSADTMAISTAAGAALNEAFLEGYAYKRAGVTATRTIGIDEDCPTLFDEPEKKEKSRRLMATLDRLNDAGIDIGLASAT